MIAEARVNKTSSLRGTAVRIAFATGVALAAACGTGTALAAATLIIVNGNLAGVGFNDPTPVAPVGGNAGTTLGAQRLNAFQNAANIWGETLNSSVPITILATFEPLTCTATSAVLGSAGAQYIDADFPGALIAGALYPIALANKLLGEDEVPGLGQIRARFNSNLGTTGCLTGTSFYLGFDNNHGTNVDLVTVLLHEFGHGLGFQTFTNGATGAFAAGLPSVWDFFLLDIETNKTWNMMSAAERAASALKPQKLVWTGAGVTAAVPSVLAAGAPELIVSTPSTAAGRYLVGTASFGPSLTAAGVTAQVLPVVDQPNGTGLACTPLSPANGAAMTGKIALVDRGTCTFNIKAQVVQAAGAVAMIVVDNVADNPPPGLGGTDDTIRIPAVRITLADGTKLKAALAFRTRSSSSVLATLDLNPNVRAGADPSNRALLYTPNPYQAGSSVSHYDVSATPNLLMEPAINSDLSHLVTVPRDLTYRLLQDMGW